jgi:DNA-binding NtrC family response regulator
VGYNRAEINVIPVNIPPLRQRRDDVAPLALHFFNEVKEKYNVDKRLESKALAVMEEYSWPGNVRELKNVIERLVVLSEEVTISAQQVAEQLNRNERQSQPPVVVNSLLPLKNAQEIVERELLNMALSRCKTTRRAAEALGIAHSSVVRKVARHNLKMVQKWTINEDN